MQIHLIAVGQKMPGWVVQGYRTFAERLPAECGLRLVEIPALRRGKNADLKRIAAREGEALLAAVPRGARIIALDEHGRQWSTRELAAQFAGWRQEGTDVALLVGGPDGLDASCRQRAHWLWSLSPLTLPHALVRVIVAEQLYRAWSIGANHPYHRE
jgi:23S rRNA (pseudouridine1915-N3)-methyltransferase